MGFKVFWGLGISNHGASHYKSRWKKETAGLESIAGFRLPGCLGIKDWGSGFRV